MNGLVAVPNVDIEVEHMPLSLEDASALHEIRIQQKLSSPTVCELIFLDPRGPLAHAEIMNAGTMIRILIKGYGQPIFSGQVTAVEHDYGPSNSLEVRVRAYDLLHQLRKRQPIRAHVQVTMPELAEELISDLGLSVKSTESGPVRQRLVQFCQSDLELLAEAGDYCGIYFTLRGHILQLLTLEGIGTAVPLALGESLLEARVDVNSDTACNSVATTAWDPWRVEQHYGRVDKARVGRHVKTQISPTKLGGSGLRTLTNKTVQDDSQAEAIAQAELDRRVAQEITLRGVADGDPLLMPGTPIEVTGIARPLGGRYVLTSVNHIIDQKKGFISEIDTTPPQPRPRSSQTLTTLGVVTQVKDPENLGRIKVSLPTYENVETDWLEVVIPGAGAAKGSIILPDLDDQVLLLVPNHDPAQALVLGGLYGVEGLPDEVVEDGAIRGYTIQTPGQQRIRLDDKDEKVRIENSRGNHLQLSPGQVRLRESNGSYLLLSDNKLQIHAETDLEIEAPGKSITIRGESINFERG